MWPTPVADGDRTTNFAQGGMSLGYAVRLMPTPTVGDSKNAANATAGRAPGSNHHSGTTLVDFVRIWPTPTQADASSGPGNASTDGGSDNLRTVVGGQLNPTWVEWLMGFPPGWTDCEPSATP